MIQETWYKIQDFSLNIKSAFNYFDFDFKFFDEPDFDTVERIEENYNAGNIKLTQDEIKVIDDLIHSIDFDVFGGH